MNTPDPFGRASDTHSKDIRELMEDGISIPGIRAHLAPMNIREHTLIKDNLFFSLSSNLLTCILNVIPESKFSPDLLSLENIAAAVSAPVIGYWNERPLSSEWLAPSPLLQPELLDWDKLNWPDEFRQSLRENLPELGTALAAARRPAVGYLGWLLTNRTFIQEHDTLLMRHALFIRASGIPKMGTIGPAVPADVSAKLNLEAPSAGQSEVLEEFELFYIRWRLQDLHGPYVPNPLMMHLPVRHLPSVLGHMKEAGKAFYLPDIYPVPDRDELTALIDSQLRPPSKAVAPSNEATPNHLAEWHEIVAATQVAKNQIDRYARIYRLQHYVRALYSRHSFSLRNAKTKLHAAFAAYFKVDADTIKADMALISTRLGSDWEREKRL